MLEHIPNPKDASRSVLLVVSILILLGSVMTTEASTYYSLTKESQATVSPPPVELQEGTAGNSTIYSNGTSAKVSVQTPTAWLNGWDKRVRITIDRNDIDTALSNIPILVYLSNSSSGRNNDDVSFIFDELQNDTNRKKIAVTKSDGLTQCYVEIEKWDDVSEKAWLWIKVPSINNITDTALYLYYDKYHADNTAYVGDTGSSAAQNVWDSSFKGVWHLSETGGGVGAIKDSTSNNNVGTDNGSPTFNATGRIDSAISFDGIDDYINMSNSASLQFTSSLTIEAWINLESFGSGSDVDIVLRKGEGNPNDYQLAIHDQKLALMIEENDDAGLESSANLTATTWYYLAGTWNGSIRRVYLNGSEDGSGPKTGNIIPDTRDICIGGRLGTDLSTGVIDEVRASNTTRSAAWIKASYESERDDLLDFGSEESNIIENVDIIDYVDNNTSDVDNSTDLGTHGNFTAQKYGPDLINDTLTEENTGGSGGNGTLLLYVNADDENKTDWTRVGTNPYLNATDYPTNFVNASGNGLLVGDFNFTDSGKSTETIDTVEVQLYAKQIQPRNLEVFVWDGSSWTSLGSETISTSWGWINWTATTDLDTWTKIDAAKIYIETRSSTGTFEVDCARLKVDYSEPEANHELDLELQWTNVDFDEFNEELCIYGGSMGAENITVDVWNGSAWQNVFTDLSGGWNNVSVTSYLNSSTFTIRFKGGTETGDTTQTTWDIDATLLHVWTEPIVDYVDNNTSDVDSSNDKGTHSNFTAQQYGPDSINDTLTEENTSEKEDYVDNNAGNVDSSADKGTHSSFAAQQSGPDSVNDTLTEGNTGTIDTLWLYVNADDETRTDWTRVGTNPYLNATDYPTNFVNASGNGLLVGDFNFTDSGKSTEEISTVQVQLYANQSDNKNLELFLWDGSSWTTRGVQALSTSLGWVNWTVTSRLDTWTKIDAAKIYLFTKSGTGTFMVDCARLKVDYFVTNNYELDLEVRWLNADYDETNEELCIYGGVMGAENITVDVWNSTGWENLFTDLNSGWNNVSVSSYLNSSTFSIRFKGGNETSDANRDTWNIDVTLIHVWGAGVNYELDLEVQWTNATYTLTNEELCIYTGTTDTEDIKVDVWNGSVWINVFADLTADSWNNISVTSYLNSSTFTIRFKGGSETGDTTQDTWDIDAVLLNVWVEVGGGPDFNYVLKFLEKDNANWKVRLTAYDNSSMGRLDNCSIYIYNGSNSTQIVILSGAYENQTGP